MKRSGIWLLSIGLCLIVLGGATAAAGYGMGADVRGVLYSEDDGLRLETAAAQSVSGLQASPDAASVTALYVDAGDADCHIVQGESFSVTCRNVREEALEVSTEDGCYTVIYDNPKLIKFTDGGQITVTIPKDHWFETAELTFGAGELEVEALNAGTLTVTGGVGEGELKNVFAGACALEIGVGELTVEAEIATEAALNCGVGELTLVLQGNEEDWDYDLSVGVGELSFGEHVALSFSAGRSRNDGREKYLSADCGIGEMNIEFSNSHTQKRSE